MCDCAVARVKIGAKDTTVNVLCIQAPRAHALEAAYALGLAGCHRYGRGRLENSEDT
jgi:hypothetical protein